MLAARSPRRWRSGVPSSSASAWSTHRGSTPSLRRTGLGALCCSHAPLETPTAWACFGGAYPGFCASRARRSRHGAAPRADALCAARTRDVHLSREEHVVLALEVAEEGATRRSLTHRSSTVWLYPWCGTARPRGIVDGAAACRFASSARGRRGRHRRRVRVGITDRGTWSPSTWPLRLGDVVSVCCPSVGAGASTELRCREKVVKAVTRGYSSSRVLRGRDHLLGAERAEGDVSVDGGLVGPTSLR